MTIKIDVQLEHASLCANKSCCCLDIGPGDVVSFGCSNSIVLYQPSSWCNDSRQVVMTYNFHQGKVLCTNWIKAISNCQVSILDYLLSGSTDKTIVIWQYSQSNSLHSQLTVLCVLNGHSDSITAIDSMYIQEQKIYLVVTASADSSVKVWSGSCLESITCVQTIDLKNAFVLDVGLHCLPKSNTPILACAADDFKIKLFVLNCSSDEALHFDKVLELHGHEDWVRGVHFVITNFDCLYLASCSQDSFIRLWRVTYGDEEDSNELKLQKQHFPVTTVNGSVYQYDVTIDAVLSGHDNWVYSARWFKSKDGNISLLSCSIDKTVVVWKYDDKNCIWVDDSRVGEIGGNTLGFYGAHFNSEGTKIIAHSYSGALHGWEMAENGSWSASALLGGHSSSANDIAWEPISGHYLLSVGDDQTTRLYGKWKSDECWHEIARPQIHGYDLQCLAVVSSTKFVSGADEKVLRVFEASRNFLENFQTLTKVVILCENKEAPEGATVPALGLSNKPVLSKGEITSSDRKVQYIENLYSPVQLYQPPPESYLLQNTLWPELRKVYGHVYEIFCITCNHSGTMLASAAKSSQPKHSAIFLWDVLLWKQVSSLVGHTLTVTQMEFSPCDKYLLSVSRDRTWILHEVVDAQAFKFETFAKSEKKTGHSRIIWSCSWSQDSKFFATASRDKKVYFWRPSAEKRIVERVALISCKAPATAVAFSTSLLSYEIAIGLENGLIKLVSLTPDCTVTELRQFGVNLSHSLAVKRLKWKPYVENDKSVKCLASCAQDNQVKIFKINLNCS